MSFSTIKSVFLLSIGFILLSATSTALPETGVGLSTNETGGLDVAFSDQEASDSLDFIDSSGNISETDFLAEESIGGIGDIDSDGDLDVVYQEGYENLTFADSSGNVTNLGVESHDAGGVADLNNDSNLEVVFANLTQKRLKFVNSSGNVTDLGVYANSVGGIADIDNDSDLDVAYTRKSDDSISFTDDEGNSQNLGVSAQEVGGIGDIDNDSDLDIAFYDSNNNLKYVNSTGNVTDLSVQAYSVGGMGDIDADGDLDIAFVGSNNKPKIIDSEGNIQNLDVENLGVKASRVGGIADFYQYPGFSSDSCSTIYSGGKYELTSDINSSSGDCMQIESDNVTLNCQGHSLTGSSSSGWEPRGVDVGSQDNVTIKNCKISNFGRGINFFSPSRNNTILNNTITDTWEALALDGGLDTPNSNNSIVNNTIQNSTLYAMVVQDDKNVDIINNTINASEGGIVYQLAYGLGELANDNSKAIIKENKITRTNGQAVELNSFDEISFKENILKNNTVGVSFQQSSYNNISNNVIKWNTDCQPNPSTNSTNSSNSTAPSLCEKNDLSFYESFNNTFFNNTFTSFRLDSNKQKPNKIIVGDFNEQIDLDNLANVTLENSTESSPADKISKKTESNLSQMFMAQNFSQEFNQSHYNTSYMVFDQGLGNGTVIYAPDDSGDTVYYPDQCANNSVPEEAPDKGCYTNSSSQVTLFVPHFSGGAITSEPACIDEDGDGYGQNCDAGTDFDDSDSNEYPGASCSRDGYTGATYNGNGECTGGTEEDNEDDGGSSGGGSSGGSGEFELGSTNPDRPSSSQSWFSTNKKKFSTSPKPETTVRNITVETVENQTNFEITVEKYSEKPDSVDDAENTHTYLEINVSASDDDIQNTSIEFSVNRSFAENHTIVLSRHHNQVWNDLPTRPVEQEGEEWTYKASSTGFSYYAVRGTEKNEEQEENQIQNNQTTEANETSQTELQSNETEDVENQSSTQSQETSRETVPQTALIAVFVMIGLLAAVGYLKKDRFSDLINGKK